MALQKSFKDSSGDTYSEGYHRVTEITIFFDEDSVMIGGKTYKNVNHRDKSESANDRPETSFCVPEAKIADFQTELDSLVKKIYPWIKENDDNFEGATDV